MFIDSDELFYEELTLEPDDDYPYFIIAKRYWTSVPEGEEQTTLVCLHSTSFHKETWEPTLSRIFKSSTCSGFLGSKIRDAWVIDCPNHGRSAVLNSTLLQLPQHAGSFTCDKYARAVYRFLHSKHFDVKERHRQNLVGLGHSLGGVAMIILQSPLLPSVVFRELIIIEPMISPLGQESLQPLRTRLVKASQRRPDTWPDRAIAQQSLAKTNGILWDPRVLEVYVKYALKVDENSTATESTSVSLCCTKFEEAAMYQDVDGPIAPVKDLDEICTRLPIHIIFGQLNDFIPKSVQDSIVDPSSPRRFESISYIPGVGHLVPQQAPDALAEKICALLEGKYDRALTGRQEHDRRSKL
ncbi:alpha/beta-hydrolase [Schizopora paradoxa]|uniref:Alpha/beta-hydrolase n=1 Tax=Schizopora paradoxa TaxID=27342 RepID=A0A0H2RWK0_9AGAM|nr:alpha/beta-hydrolase [Schizopora paradoxa]